MDTMKASWIFGLIAFGVFVTMFRYDYTSKGQVIVRVDRWTGEVCQSGAPIAFWLCGQPTIEDVRQ